MARNLYTYEDRVSWTHGAHQFSFGAWFQQFQSNETIALSQYGQATFTSLATFLTGVTSTFLYDPAPTEMNWRSLFGALYAQDVIRMNPNFTLTLGFRGEFSTGWNEAHGRAANYTFTNGVISNQPRIASSAFTDEQREVPAAAANRFRVEPLPRQDRGARRVRNVQRTAGCVGLSHGPECAFQPNLQHCRADGGQAPHRPECAGSSEGAARSRRSSTEPEYADADLLHPATRTGAHSEYDANARLRRIAWLP